MLATLEHPPASRPCGDIDCRLVGNRSTLVRCYSRAPLKLLTPSPIGDAAHVVMSSFGGGLVSGDDVPISVSIDRGASCVLSTQSAGKAYRSDGRPTSQSLVATVADDAFLAVLPDPLCCFAGARFVQRQSFDLEATANLVWLDAITSGRWARGERWQFDSLDARCDVRVGGRLVLREAMRLDGDLTSPFRVGAFDTYAVLAIVGPRVAAVAEFARQRVAELTVDRHHTMPLASCSKLDEHGVILRVLGAAAQSVQQFLRPIVAQLADVIGADPWARKW